MKRKAFLIASPLVEGSSGYLKGVTPDIVNMKAHLKSLSGGAWEENEIIVFHNPTKADLKLAMTKEQYDFVIVQYSGHGFEYTSKGTQLHINSVEHIGLEDIHSWVLPPRGYYFIDCCRGVEQLLKKAESFVAMDSISESVDLRPRYRKKYEDLVQACERGVSIIYSCSIEESADEDDKGRGGIFSLSYFNSAKSLSDVKFDEHHGIKFVFDVANAVMNKLYPLNSQHPTMKPERRNKYFPFVI